MKWSNSLTRKDADPAARRTRSDVQGFTGYRHPLSEYFKGHDKIAARQAAGYARQQGTFTFTSVTVHEIVFGLEVKGASRQLQKALSWLNQNEEITPTANDYYEAAVIKATARKQGSILELTDCLIAAAAVRLGLPLVTGNAEDFEAIQKTGVKLDIENWHKA